MTAPTLGEQVEMVGDLLEPMLIDPAEATEILAGAAHLSLWLSAHLLLGEMRRREEDVALRDAAAEERMRRDDGSWT